MHLTDAEERWLWTTGGTLALLFLVGPVLRSPDGMEMLRLGASWLGHSVEVGDPHFWPPLWSVLTLPAVGLGIGPEGGRVLNVLCWGLLIWPLHMLGSELGGRAAARRTVLLYLCLPMLTLFAPMLDARALGALIATSFVASSVHAARTGGGLKWVILCGALAPLARPEGLILSVLVGGVVFLAGRVWWKGVLASVLALLPHGILRGSFRGLTGHEQLFAPWFETWSTWDLLSLFGPASVPTDFRRFALAAVDVGVVSPRPAIDDFVGVLMAVPGGVFGAVTALAGAVGFCGIVLGIRGFVMVLPQRRKWAVIVISILPFFAIAAAPMAKGQAGPLSNFLFIIPSFMALMGVGSRWLGAKWVPWAFLGLVAVETYTTPLMPAAPYFLEGSESADLARAMLKLDPPKSGQVATDFSGRDVVMGAGLTVRALGPIWSGSVPGDVDAILINSVGAAGEDGGRTLSLLESGEWTVAWVTGDGDLRSLHHETPNTPRPERGWYALMRESPSTPRWERGWYALLVRR